MRVFRYVNKIATGPMPLPRKAVKNLLTGAMISTLSGASDVVLNECGYYRTILAVADAGHVIVNSHWPTEPTDGFFVEVIDRQVTEAHYQESLEADAQAEHDADAPLNGWESWTKRERFFLRMLFKIAKMYHPTLTQAQFLNQAKPEWDVVK